MRRKSGFIIIGILLSLLLGARISPLYAQTSNYSPKSVEIPSNDTGKLRQLIRDAMDIFFHNPDSAMLLARKAEFHSRRSGFDQGVFFALNVRGYFLRNKGLYDSSIIVLKQAIPYTRNPELTGYTHSVYNSMALAASNTGQYELALQWFEQALTAMSVKRFSDNHSATVDSCTVLVNMAIMWSRLGEYEQSIKLLKQAEKTAVQANSWYSHTQICVNLGEVALLTKKYGDAIHYFNKALYLTKDNNQYNFRFCAWGGLANVYLEQHKANQALSILRDTMNAEGIPTGDVYLYLHWKHSLGVAYLQLKEYDKGFSLLKTALDSAVTLKHDELIQLIAPDAARAASGAGRHQDAYNFLNIYSSLRDTLFEREKVRFLRAWTKNQIAEKDKTVFAQKLYISQQHAQIQIRNFIVVCTTGGLLLLLITGIGLYRNYHHKRKIQLSEMQQLQQQQELNSLKARVQGEEQERNRIAAELHNGVAAQLWGTRINVDMLQRQDDLSKQHKEKLQDIYNQLEETAQDIRKTAHNMMPDLLLDEGLSPALVSLCVKTRRNTGLDTEYQEYGCIPRLDPEIEHLLYRMVQELVQNTMKHAITATRLLVQLSCSDNILNITVEDNGRGFTLPHKEFGLGLQHISRNVQTLRGSMDIKSSPDKGTTIYIEFDIEHLL